MGNHRCPADGCGMRVATHLLMCRPHWDLVPEPLASAIYSTWAHGLGAGSASHRAAIDAAIEAVNRKLANAETQRNSPGKVT